MQQLSRDIYLGKPAIPYGQISSRQPSPQLCNSLCWSINKENVDSVSAHGVLVYNEPTNYYHQRHLLIPTIISFWRKYQTKLLDSLKGKEVVLAGDGRHDSMGHSAKYGTYTIFCCTVGLIIHIVLLQASEKTS